MSNRNRLYILVSGGVLQEITTPDDPSSFEIIFEDEDNDETELYGSIQRITETRWDKLKQFLALWEEMNRLVGELGDEI